MVGVMNLRGNILSVVDIRIFFGLPKVTVSERTRILVVEGEGLRIGIIVEQVDEITKKMAKLPKQFTVGDVKEELGLSRKYVVPILEWLDANLITVRKGEKRSLRGVGGSD